MDNLRLQDTICFYRKRQGLTQAALAAKLGVTNQSVSKWELAQCYPDISLIPQLAEIFDISIDELFGKEPKQAVINYDLCTEFPWADDETLRVVFARGRKMLQQNNDINEFINIRFPENCNETTKQYFKVEVFGNICCDASINGDVICHGHTECNQINGDIKECRDNISCTGDINGSVNCGNNISCAGYINGNVNCGNDVACGDNIKGNVTCGGSIECKKIEGDADCKGDIIYK